MTEADKQLYKVASSGMCKRALQLDDTAKASIIGALGGAGIGALSHAITPKDEDEDKRERLIKNMLYGAAMGGLAGYGSKKFYDMSKPKVVKDSWAERNLDPSLSTVLGATSIGAGGVGASRLLNKLFTAKGGDIVSPILQEGRYSTLADTLKSLGLKASDRQARPIIDAYNAYSRSMSSPLGRFFTTLNNLSGGRLERINKFNLKIPSIAIKGKTYLNGRSIDLASAIKNAILNQRASDVSLAQALYNARHATGGAALHPFVPPVTTGLKSLWSNPRKIIQAARSNKGAARAFGVSGAAMLAALLAKSVSKDRQQ